MRTDIIARGAYAVTPSDTVELSPLPYQLRIVADGALAVVTEAGDTLTFPVAKYEVINLRTRRVLAATTASVIAFYS